MRQPWSINRGWPMHTQTDVTALHLEHESGPCQYESTYHALGLIVNSALAIGVGTLLTYMIVVGPGFFAKQAVLRREH